MGKVKRLYAPMFKKSKDDKRWTWATFTMTNEGVQKTKRFRPLVKETAIRVYQDWLLAPFLEGVDEIRGLRPITPKQAEEYFSERREGI